MARNEPFLLLWPSSHSRALDLQAWRATASAGGDTTAGRRSDEWCLRREREFMLWVGVEIDVSRVLRGR